VSGNLPAGRNLATSATALATCCYVDGDHYASGFLAMKNHALPWIHNVVGLVVDVIVVFFVSSIRHKGP